MSTRNLSGALSRRFHVSDDFAVPNDPIGNASPLRTEVASATLDDSAAIDLLYMTYAGRHATAAEITNLGARIANGSTTLRSARSALLTADDAGPDLTETAVGHSRDLSVRMAASPDIRATDTTLLGGALAHGDASRLVTQDPSTGAASDPLLSDVVTRLLALQLRGALGSVAVDSPSASSSRDDLATTIASADPASAGSTSAPSTTSAATGEASLSGASLAAVGADTLASYFGSQLAALSSSGVTATNTVNTSAPTTSTGQTTTTVTPPTTSTGQTTTTVTPPTTSTGQTTTTVTPPASQHPAIDPAVLTHIYEGFGAFLGRAPTSTEATNWSASVQADGTGLATLRSTVLAGGEGQAYTAAQVTAAYQQLAGRAPTGAEIAGWQDVIANQGGTLDGMRHAIVDSADGLAAAGTSVAANFSAYLGRAPTTAEMQGELAGMAQGRTIEGVAAELITSVEGVVHFNDTLATLFPQLLGHQATQAESSTWFSALVQGATYDTMRATLMLDPTSTASHLIGTVANDRFTLAGAPGDVTISAFDAANDRIALDSRYAGINPLDAAHASQVLSRDGETPNVLIRLDDHDTLLLHGVTLAQLSAADFVFG